MMNKTMWARPNARVEEFQANEYVAACWGVACAYDKANEVEQKKHGGAWEGWIHRAAQCGSSSNQYLQDTDGNGEYDKMTEVGTDGLGNLPCTRYTDGNYNETAGFSDVKADQYIYWTTSSGGKTWYHQGRTVAEETDHPNRS